MTTAQALLRIAKAHAATEAGYYAISRGAIWYPGGRELSQVQALGDVHYQGFSTPTDALTAAADVLSLPISEDMQKAINAVTVLEHDGFKEIRRTPQGCRVQVRSLIVCGDSSSPFAPLGASAKGLRSGE